MKNFIIIASLFISFVLNAQETQKPDFKNMSPEQRKEYIKQMPPEQRGKLMENAIVNMTIRNLMVSEEKQEAFKKLLKEYHESQRAIKDNFKSNFSKDNLSDADAKKTLEQSFELGQQLLDNRKLYADKFLKILTPQQVLKLFSQEKKMREKMMERRKEMGPPRGRGPAMED